MALKDIVRNPLFQYSLEIVLPIVGYLFLDWSLPVIITFYFFDYLGSEISRHRRHQAVLKVNSAASKSKFIGGLFISIVVFTSSLTVLYFILLNQALNVSAESNSMGEIIIFLKDEGWILLPVVFLAYHLKDKMAFYMPKKFHDYSFDKLMKNYFIEIAILFVLIIGGLFAYSYLAEQKIDGLVLLGIFVAFKLAFDFLIVKPLDKKSKG